jgi:hypothetical protein
MDQTLAWIALPALAVTTALGSGLLVERLVGARAPRGLVLPLGFAASVALLAVPYSVGLGARWAAALLALTTVVGLVVERGRMRKALPDLPAAVAALGVYVVYVAPVALSGDATFAGYTFLGDTSVHFALIDYITVHGTDIVDLAPSNYERVTQTQLENGYPLGLHFELATLRQVLGIGTDEAYHPFMAVSIALAALPAARLLEALGIPRLLACAGGAVALVAYLPYSYALQGGIKEMGMICFLLLGAALAMEVARGRNPVRDALLFGLVVAAAFQVYSVGGLPWFGLIGAAVLVGVAVWNPGRRRQIVIATGAAAVAFGVAALPALPDAFDFYGEGSRLLTSSEGSDVGNLLGPVPGWEAFGIWLRHDYRLPTSRPELTYAMIGGAAVLALLGGVWSLRARRLGVLLVMAAAVAVWIVLPAGLYIEGKLLAIMSPAVVLLSITGAWALSRTGHGPEGALLALALAGTVLLSDAMAYRGVYLAPKPRVAELAEIGERFSGQGPAMLPEFEEYGKHYLRELDALVPTDGWTTQVAQRRRPGPVYANSLDLDELDLGFVQQFPLLVVRRSPVASRPPGSYQLAMRGDYYDVWRRDGSGVSTDHVPAGDADDPTATLQCGRVRRLAADARELGQELLIARRTPPLSLPVRRMAYPPTWALAPDKRVVPQGQGRATGALRAPAGRYRVWVRGTFGRGLDVRVDGRHAGRAEDVQTPGGASLVGEVTVAGDRHRVELFRSGGNLLPGNRRDEGYDRIFLEPVERLPVERVAPARSRSACAGPVDWIEIVKPRR